MGGMSDPLQEARRLSRMELAELRGSWLGRVGRVPENALRLLEEHGALAQRAEDAERENEGKNATIQRLGRLAKRHANELRDFKAEVEAAFEVDDVHEALELVRQALRQEEER